MITLNNPGTNPEECFFLIKNHTEINYACGQLEEVTTPHLQAYFNFKNPVRLASIKAIYPTAHIEACKDASASRAYCMKEESRKLGPWEFGEYKTKGGQKDNKNASNRELAERIRDNDVVDLVMDGSIPFYRAKAAREF